MRSLVLAASLALFAAACGSNGDSKGESVCANDTRAEAYVAGIEKMSSGNYKVMIMDSMPAPPIKGTNEWMIHVIDPMGNMVDDATVKITPFMPDHGHGTTMQSTVTPMGEGMYKATPVYFFMAGFWRITVDVTPPGKALETVAFNFCVDG